MSNYDILKAYIFKKNQDIIDKFPDNLDISITNNPYYNIVNIPNNKGDNGISGNVNFSNDVIEYDQKCKYCVPTDKPEKTKIENINKDGDITINPSININNSLLVKDKIRIDNNNITYNNINTLKELLNSDLKCEQGYYLTGNTNTSIGKCIPCGNSNLLNIIYTTNTCDWKCDTNYTINPDNDDECLKLCSDGYKRNETENTCEPCGVDTYKSDSNIDTSCSSCPIGSTTNDNTTAKSITDCTAKPGYKKDGDYIYTLLEGNIIENGELVSCENRYYYNDYDSECQPCIIFGEGIECNTSNIQYSKRTLKSGYGLDNNTSYPCKNDEYRNGDVDIDYNKTSLPCISCPMGSTGNNSTIGPNDECTLLPGYNWKTDKSSPPDYEVTLKPGNIDTSSPYKGISSCGTGYYYNDTSQECESCNDSDGNDSDGIECTGGPIQEAKKMLLPGYSSTTREGFTNYITECDGDSEYRHDKVEYSDTDEIPCNECPIGSISNDDNNACNLNNGYRWEDNSSSPPNYQTTLMSGNLDENTDGTIDGCSLGYYYNDIDCVLCDYENGVKCDGGTLDGSKRTLLPGYSWNGNTAEACGYNEYRLGEVEIQDDTINCNQCPTGTMGNGSNVCVLNTGYSWPDDIDIEKNLYNEPLTNSGYYYENDVAIACTDGYYNLGNNECTLCPTEGINCNGNRDFANANRTLEPNYSWNRVSETASKCGEGLKREGNVVIDSSDITCNPCGNKPNHSYYKNNDNKQLYNVDGSCYWECEENYTINPDGDECLILCSDGYKRNETENTCEPCGVDTYKSDSNIDTSCSPCPTGSTTNTNETATAITDCTARPGYTGSDYNYTLKPGNLDEESPIGEIDGCAHNYGFNEAETECTICPDIINGIYDLSRTPNNCSNIICNPGYKLDNGTCQPCGINHYKDGTNDNECSECPIGSTTGNNNIATAITNCTARPGYMGSGNSYSLIDGNLDSSQDGVIDGCSQGYYYNGTECVNCEELFGDGIECTGGPIDGSKRTLLPGYSWNGTTAQSCGINEYRKGEEIIQDNESVRCNSCPTGTTYDGSNGCELMTGYSWEDGNGIRDDNIYNIPVRDNDAYIYQDDIATKCNENYYYDNTICVSCTDFGVGVECPGGDLKETAFRYLKPGYKWNSSEEKSNECDEGKYRSARENVKINNSSINCTNTCDGNKHVNSDRTGCIDNDGYTYYGDNLEYFYCSVGYYYTNEGECTYCGKNDAVECPGGSEDGERGIKILKGGWEKRGLEGQENRCAIDYFREESDYNGENTTCISCEAGHTTNDKIGQSYCIEQCSSDNQYYDETYCPENSSYSSYDDGSGNCTCDPGYQVNSDNNGCDAITFS